MKMSKYTIDCFTPRQAGTLYPENTYHAEDADEIADIIKNCTKKIAGISHIEIYINIKEEDCLDCRGTGLIDKTICLTCNGFGYINVNS